MISPSSFIFKEINNRKYDCRFSMDRVKKEERYMFLGMEWYWWIVLVIAVGVLIPLKLKFMHEWSKRRQEKKKEQRGKWGDEE